MRITTPIDPVVPYVKRDRNRYDDNTGPQDWIYTQDSDGAWAKVAVTAMSIHAMQTAIRRWLEYFASKYGLTVPQVDRALTDKFGEDWRWQYADGDIDNDDVNGVLSDEQIQARPDLPTDPNAPPVDPLSGILRNPYEKPDDPPVSPTQPDADDAPDPANTQDTKSETPQTQPTEKPAGPPLPGKKETSLWTWIDWYRYFRSIGHDHIEAERKAAEQSDVVDESGETDKPGRDDPPVPTLPWLNIPFDIFPELNPDNIPENPSVDDPGTGQLPDEVPDNEPESTPTDDEPETNPFSGEGPPWPGHIDPTGTTGDPGTSGDSTGDMDGDSSGDDNDDAGVDPSGDGTEPGSPGDPGKPGKPTPEPPGVPDFIPNPPGPGQTPDPGSDAGPDDPAEQRPDTPRIEDVSMMLNSMVAIGAQAALSPGPIGFLKPPAPKLTRVPRTWYTPKYSFKFSHWRR